MAQTEEEFRRLNEQLINSIQDLAGLSAETRRLTAAEKSAADEAAKFQAKLGMSGAAAAAAGKAFVSYTKAIYDGETANKAASQSMTDMAEAAKYAGAFLALLVPGGPLVKGLVAGLGLLTSKLIESGKLVAEQADSIYKSYRELAKAGATGAGAMQDTFDGLQRLGLGVERFNEVIRMVNENAAELADFGGTVNRGKKIFEKSMQDMTDQQRIQMEQMGLDRTAQAEATLEYIKQQRLLTRGTRDQMDTSSTAVMRYVKETDLLTRITGLNRKEQEKLMDDAMRNEAFNATLQQIREEQGEAAAKQVQAALVMAQKAGPETAKQFMASISGFVGSSDEAGQAFMATGGKIAEVADALRSGQLKNTKDTAVAMNDLFKAYGDTARQFRGQAQMMNYGKTFGSFYEAVKAGQMSIEDLAKAYDEAQQQQKDQLTDPLTRKAAQMENDARAKQIADQKLVNLGMEAFITANSLAAENARKLSEAALAAALALDKLRESSDKKRTQSLETAKKTHEATTQTALEAADRAKAVAKDPNATREEKQAAKDAADRAAAASQQTAREQAEANLREKNKRRKEKLDAAKKGVAGTPAMQPPAAPATAPGGGGAAPGGGGAAPGGGGAAPGGGGAAPGGGGAAPGGGGAAPGGGGAAPAAPGGGGGAAPGGGGQEHVFTGPMGPAAAPGGGGAAPAAPKAAAPASNIQENVFTGPMAAAPAAATAGKGTRPSNVTLESNRVDLSKVDPKLLENFFAAAKEYNKPVRINSAYRGDEYQAQLWVRGNILKEPGIWMPSRPEKTQKITYKGKEYTVEGSGRGNTHGRGQALDITPGAGSDFQSILAKYGIVYPLGSDDPPHIQLAKKTKSSDAGDTEKVQPGKDLKTAQAGKDGAEVLPNFDVRIGNEIRKGGTISWRTQNPGNISFADITKKHGALVPWINPNGDKQQRTVGIAVMPTLEAGENAQMELWRRPLYNNRSIASGVKMWVTGKELKEGEELGHVQGYASDLAKAAGVSLNHKIKDLDDGQLRSLVQKQKHWEGYKPGTVVKAAKGGVFDGPMSGYPAELHGNEAVIPLDGGAVPVKFDRSFIADIINSQKERMANTAEAASTAAAVTASANSLTNLIDIMRQTQSSNDALISAMNEMVKAQKNSNDIQNKLLSYAQN